MKTFLSIKKVTCSLLALSVLTRLEKHFCKVGSALWAAHRRSQVTGNDMSPKVGLSELINANAATHSVGTATFVLSYISSSPKRTGRGTLSEIEISAFLPNLRTSDGTRKVQI